MVSNTLLQLIFVISGLVVEIMKIDTDGIKKKFVAKLDAKLSYNHLKRTTANLKHNKQN